MINAWASFHFIHLEKTTSMFNARLVVAWFRSTIPSISFRTWLTWELSWMMLLIGVKNAQKNISPGKKNTAKA